MKTLKMVVSALVVVAWCTGCSGIELGGKVGLYAVDERHEVQDTRSKSMPLKCRFVQCTNAELQGS
jgi:hypothetical protein